jgi:hypothetical protein
MVGSDPGIEASVVAAAVCNCTVGHAECPIDRTLSDIYELYASVRNDHQAPEQNAGGTQRDRRRARSTR